MFFSPTEQYTIKFRIPKFRIHFCLKVFLKLITTIGLLLILYTKYRSSLPERQYSVSRDRYVNVTWDGKISKFTNQQCDLRKVLYLYKLDFHKMYVYSYTSQSLDSGTDEKLDLIMCPTMFFENFSHLVCLKRGASSAAYCSVVVERKSFPVQYSRPTRTL